MYDIGLNQSILNHLKCALNTLCIDIFRHFKCVFLMDLNYFLRLIEYDSASVSSFIYTDLYMYINPFKYFVDY